MAELVSVSGKIVKVNKHKDFCPVPNAVEEIARLNNRPVREHQHAWLQGQNMRLPDNTWARLVKCRLCPVRVMVMFTPLETRTWDSNDYDMAKVGR